LFRNKKGLAPGSVYRRKRETVLMTSEEELPRYILFLMISTTFLSVTIKPVEDDHDTTIF